MASNLEAIFAIKELQFRCQFLYSLEESQQLFELCEELECGLDLVDADRYIRWVQIPWGFEVKIINRL